MTEPKTVVCTTTDLSRAADKIIDALKGKASLTKPMILNSIARAIAGPKHDWGLLKSKGHGAARDQAPAPAETDYGAIRLAYGVSHADGSATLKVQVADLEWAFLKISANVLSGYSDGLFGKRAPQVNLVVLAHDQHHRIDKFVHLTGAGPATLRVRVDGMPDNIMSYENFLEIVFFARAK